MPDFTLSPLANDDLYEIWVTIAEDHVGNADRFIERLKLAMSRLAERPNMGHLREDLADDRLRVWTVKDYLIIYRPENRPIQIVRVVSGFRDLTELAT